jgi:hypothetical protein
MLLPEYHPAYHFYGFPKKDKNIDIPFLHYCLSDKTSYKFASTKYLDVENDFRMTDDEAFLLNIDFVFVDVHKFTEVADYYDKYEVYTHLNKYSIEYKQFWGRETFRRKNGLTRKCKLLFTDIEEYVNPDTTEERKKELLKPLHITGNHYNYLNYSRIARTKTDEELAQELKEGLQSAFEKTKVGFPFFIDGDYWDFKIDEFAILNNFDLAKAKARRKGYSYKEGSKGSNKMNLYKNSKILYLAYDINFLTDEGAISSMVKTNLDWYETQTHWKRNFLSMVLTDIKLGYKDDTGKIELGWKSIAWSRACKIKLNQAVGKQASEIIYEESGAFPNILEVIGVTKSVNEVGAIKVGKSTYFGTGGTKEGDYISFKYIFRFPRANGCMPFLNVFDIDSTHQNCGFFYPQILGLLPYVKDGNSQLVDAAYYDEDDKIEAKKYKTYSEYVIYLGQRANTPIEAFISNVENIYSSVELNNHIHKVENDGNYRFWRDGWYESDKGKGDVTNLQVSFVDKSKCNSRWNFIEEVPFSIKNDVHGLVREYFPPIKQNGVTIRDRYIVFYDTVKIDKDVNTLKKTHSLAAIQVWDKEKGVLMAEWIGRLNMNEDMDFIYLMFINYWNATGLPEVNVGEVLKNFKTWNKSHLLERDPSSIITKGKKDANAGYGVVIANGVAGFKYYEYLQQFLYEEINRDIEGNIRYRFQNCYSLPLLRSMQIFNLELNLDALACARLAGVYFKALGLNHFTKTNTQLKESMAKRIKSLTG